MRGDLGNPKQHGRERQDRAELVGFARQGDVFVEGKASISARPSTYRVRRLRDATRLLPIGAFILFLLPIILPASNGIVAQMLIFFASWLLLIVVASLLSTALARGDRDNEATKNSR